MSQIFFGKRIVFYK